MKNPWEEIPLTDYESHMKLDSVMQLQTMNEMMKSLFNTYPISGTMIFGIAGGNGLEHIQKDKIERVYGVDINSSYLQAVIQRYPELNGLLECLCINLIDETIKLPKADMVIANLLIEYFSPYQPHGRADCRDDGSEAQDAFCPGVDQLVKPQRIAQTLPHQNGSIKNQIIGCDDIQPVIVFLQPFGHFVGSFINR